MNLLRGWSLLLITALLGCGASPVQEFEIIEDTWSPPDFVEVVSDCLGPTMNLVEVLEVGGGYRVLVRVSGEDGAGVAGLDETGFHLTAGAAAQPFLVAGGLPGATLLSLILASPEAADAAKRILASIPEEIPVALFTTGGGSGQISGFSLDRNQVADLPEGFFSPGSNDDLPGFLGEVLRETWRLECPAPPCRRVVAILGLPGDGGTDLAGLGPVELWVNPDEGSFAQDLQATPGFYNLMFCPVDAGSLEVKLDGGCGFHLEVSPGEQCLLQDLEAAEVPLPKVVEFHFSEDQRVIFDDFRARKDTEDFSLSVSFDDGPSRQATAHLRGQTSLDCQRKSYNVNLKGKEPVALADGLVSDHFLLISMCKDDRYFQQITANHLAQGLGFFELGHDLVELKIDGVTQGVYLVMEVAGEGLVDGHSQVDLVIRRRFDPGDDPVEIKYPEFTGSGESLLEGYNALASIPEAVQGQDLVQQARTLMNLEQFLDFLAFQSLMGNGDFVDELFFWSAQAWGQGGFISRFSFSAWDMDDLYSACHHQGKHAMVDPWKLLFCAEGNLEKRLLADPAVYALFVDRLEDMIVNRLTPEVLDQALDTVRASLEPFFQREEVCGAMVELLASNPAAGDPIEAWADISGKIDELRQDFLEHREVLLERIAAYRDEAGR